MRSEPDYEAQPGESSLKAGEDGRPTRCQEEPRPIRPPAHRRGGGVDGQGPESSHSSPRASSILNIPCARRLVDRFNKSPPTAASGRFDLGADRWLSDHVANHRDKLGWLHRLREK